MSKLHKIALLLMLLLGLALPASAQITRVGSQFACATPGNLFAGTTTFTYTLPGTPTAGNLVVVAVDVETRTVTGIAGTATTYTISGANSGNGAAARNLSIWHAIAAGTDTTVTITLSGNTGATAYVCFAEFTGNNASQASATFNGGSNDAATAHSGGSVTPPTAHNVVVMAQGRTPGTWTEDGDISANRIISADTSFVFGYFIQTSATAASLDTTSVDPEYSESRIAAYAGAAGGGGGAGPFRTATGVGR